MNDWNAASRNGSRSIVIWESPDLKHWSSARLVEISPATAGNTWAPEAIWDSNRRAYMVFWASSLYPENDKIHGSGSYHRILRSFTTDFVTFSNAEVWMNFNSSTIDTTIAFDARHSEYYRFTKNEHTKFIFQESSKSLDGPYQSVREGIGKGSISMGEGPTVFPSIDTPGKVCHLADLD